jgi:hypothetical protein
MTEARRDTVVAVDNGRARLTRGDGRPLSRMSASGS